MAKNYRVLNSDFSTIDQVGTLLSAATRVKGAGSKNCIDNL